MVGIRKIGFVLAILSVFVAISLTANLALADVNRVVKDYPLSPESTCGASRTCSNVLETWNNATWQDVVDDDIDTGNKIASVRWYFTEAPCTGPFCEDQLKGGNDCPYLRNVSQNKFCMVTDEFGNVLLSMSMGNNQYRYEKLHNMSEMLRHPVPNGL